MSGDVLSESPDSGQEEIVSVALEIEQGEVFECESAALSLDRSAEHVAPQDLSHLEIDEMRSVKGDAGRSDPLGNTASDDGVEQQLQHRRGVEDDQSRSRSSRKS